METKEKAILGISIAVMLVCTFFGGAMYGYDKGFVVGIETITEIIETQYGITVLTTKLADGSYEFLVELPSGELKFNIEIHLWVTHIRQGKVLSQTYHAMSLTNEGKDWIADNLANSGGANVTKFIRYLANSNSSDSFSAAWTALPDEITTDGLERSLGTFQDTTTGTWNMTNSFSVSGTNSTKLYGLYTDTAGTDWNSLVAAEQQGVGNQKNVVNGDTLQVTAQGTIS